MLIFIITKDNNFLSKILYNFQAFQWIIEYTFKVNVKANKLQVKRAVSKLFSVTATDCNILNVKRKQKANLPVSKASYKRGHGYTAAWKKAIVTLADGEKIDMFEGA